MLPEWIQGQKTARQALFLQISESRHTDSPRPKAHMIKADRYLANEALNRGGLKYVIGTRFPGSVKNHWTITRVQARDKDTAHTNSRCQQRRPTITKPQDADKASRLECFCLPCSCRKPLFTSSSPPYKLLSPPEALAVSIQPSV